MSIGVPGSDLFDGGPGTEISCWKNLIQPTFRVELSQRFVAFAGTDEGAVGEGTALVLLSDEFAQPGIAHVAQLLRDQVLQEAWNAKTELGTSLAQGGPKVVAVLAPIDARAACARSGMRRAVFAIRVRFCGLHLRDIGAILSFFVFSL